MTSPKQTSLQLRRNFLKSSLTAATVTIVAPHVLGGPRHIAPSDRVNVALVGAGGRGLQNARDLMKLDDVRITTVADPAESWDLAKFYYKGIAGRLPAIAEIEKHYQQKDANFKCLGFEDFREMLDKAKDVDAVLCATPDHAHATVSIAAMRQSKHVYCEKPLTHNIAEARLVAKIAKESGVATQMGNQGHSNEGMRVTLEHLQQNSLGEIREVHAWVPAVRWNPELADLPTATHPVPKGLNWDLWCGPRKPPEFNHAFAPVAWRDFWMFGCGALGDFGCHDLDSAVWGLDLPMPSEIEFYPAGRVDRHTAPYGEVGHYRFARSGKADLKVHWYSGGLRPAKPDQMPDDKTLPSRGVLFIGAKGVMVCGGAGGMPMLYPEEINKTPNKTVARSNGHHRDWIDAIKGGPPASSNFEYGAKLTEITLLGLLSLRSGATVHWDAERLAAPGVPDAELIIHGDYREGWKLS